MTDITGPCSSCGRIVKGTKSLHGPMQFHCKEPPCWPISLWLLDSEYEEQIKKLFNELLESK